MISPYFTHDGFTPPNMTPLIRVYDEAGNVIETHEQAGEFTFNRGVWSLS